MGKKRCKKGGRDYSSFVRGEDVEEGHRSGNTMKKKWAREAEKFF